MKLHEILIGVVIVGLISSGLIVWLSSGTTVYSPDGFNESTFDSFNKMNEINSQVETYNNNSGTVEKNSFADRLGALFTSSYQSAQVMKNSADVLNDMTNDGLSNVGIFGGFGNTLKVAIGSLIFIVVFIGIFFHFVTKSDRV